MYCIQEWIRQHINISICYVNYSFFFISSCSKSSVSLVHSLSFAISCSHSCIILRTCRTLSTRWLYSSPIFTQHRFSVVIVVVVRRFGPFFVLFSFWWYSHPWFSDTIWYWCSCRRFAEVSTLENLHVQSCSFDRNRFCCLNKNSS